MVVKGIIQIGARKQETRGFLMTKKTSDKDDVYLDVKKAAEYLSVSTTTMYRLIYEGSLKYHQEGYKHRIRIRISDLVKYMERIKA